MNQSTIKFRKPPTQRQRWGDSQVLPHTNWGDLFFDLFYVAAAYNLAYIIKSDTNFVGLLYFAGCFGPVKNIWINKMTYDSMFQLPDDIIHVFFEILKLLFLATAVLHIRPVKYMSNASSNPEMFLFCLANWLSIAYFMCLHLEIIFWGVNGQSSAIYSAVTSILIETPSFILVTAATVYSGFERYYNNGVDDYHRNLGSENDNYSGEYTEATITHIPIILMLCSWIIRQVVFYPIRIYRGKGKEFKKFTVPVNVEFVIHRQGEWTMLMLGESVLSLLIVEVSNEIYAFYATFYIGILSVTFLQYLYFKSQPHDASEHALRRSRIGGTLYLTFMQYYSAALIIVGVSFKMLLTEYKYEYEEVSNSDYRSLAENYRFLADSGDKDSKYSMEERRRRIAIFFCLGIGISFFTLDLMSIAHKGINKIHDRYFSSKNSTSQVAGFTLLALRPAVVIFISTCFLYITEPEQVALAGLFSILLQVILRLVGFFYFPAKESMHNSELSASIWPNVTQAASIKVSDHQLPHLDDIKLKNNTQSFNENNSPDSIIKSNQGKELLLAHPESTTITYNLDSSNQDKDVFLVHPESNTYNLDSDDVNKINASPFNAARSTDQDKLANMTQPDNAREGFEDAEC